MITPEDVIAAARMKVYNRHPYLSHLIFSLRPCKAPGLGTMAVDKGWRLFYDPEVVVEWHEEMLDRIKKKVKDPHHGVAAVIFHELGHVMRSHFERMRDKAENDPWGVNFAQDREINDDLEECGWKLPVKCLMPSDIGMANGLMAEEYYRPTPVINCKIVMPGGGGKCGGVAHNPTDWEKQHGNDPGNPPAIDEMQAEIVLVKTANDIANAEKANKGSVPAGLKAWAEARLEPPKIDWRSRLKSLCRQSLAAITGACDFTWKQPGRKSLYSAGRKGYPLSPSLYQPKPKVGVVLDTSGSMSCKNGETTIMESALSELLGLAKAAGASVIAAACDADVHAVANVTGRSDLEKLNLGGGGTNMRPGYEAIRKKRVDLAVIITDGLVGNDWPTEEDCRGVRNLAVLVGPCEKPPSYIPYVEAK